MESAYSPGHIKTRHHNAITPLDRVPSISPQNSGIYSFRTPFLQADHLPSLVSSKLTQIAVTHRFEALPSSARFSATLPCDERRSFLYFDDAMIVSNMLSFPSRDLRRHQHHTGTSCRRTLIARNPPARPPRWSRALVLLPLRHLLPAIAQRNDVSPRRPWNHRDLMQRATYWGISR